MSNTNEMSDLAIIFSTDNMSDLQIYRLFKRNTYLLTSLLRDRVMNDVKTELDDKDAALLSCLQWIFRDGCKKWVGNLNEQGCFGDDEFTIVEWSSQCDWDEIETSLQSLYREDWERLQASD